MDGTYKKIGILDHMGWGNLGDAALQEVFIANIKKRLPDACLIAFSLNPDDTRERHNIASYPIIWSYTRCNGSDSLPAKAADLNSKLKSLLKRFNIFYALAKPIRNSVREVAHLIGSYRVVRSLDLLVLSGGGQLCELWRGPWSHPYNVFKFCVLAKLARTPVFIVGVGAGPLNHPLSKFFAKWSVRLSRYTSFRDAESQALLRALSAKTKTYVYPDPAYALDLSDYATAKPEKRSRPKVGLNPIGFCDPRRWAPREDEAIYRRYLDKLAAFSSWLLAHNYDLEVFTAEISVDRYAIEDLGKMLPKDASPNGTSRVTCTPVLNLKELLAQMATFDFVITAKFHGVIFSHLLAKPVIALSYHPKIDDLMRTVGHDRYCLDIEHFDVASLIETFELLVQNSDDLSSRFRRTAETYGNAVQAQFDNLFHPRLQE